MVNEELIIKLLDELDRRTPYFLKLKDYYEGRHKVLTDPSMNVDDNRHDERAEFNYCYKVTQNYVGYLLGKPVSYKSKSGNEIYMKMIDKYFSDWEKDHNIYLKTLSEIYGVAYEVSYSTKNKEFLCAAFSPLEMITLTDGTIQKNVSVAVRRYKKPFDDNVYVDVWDDTHLCKYTIKDKKLTLLKKKRNLISNVCPVVEFPNNDTKKSAFAGIVRINDLYNAVNSSAANEMLDHRSAYLVIENADLTLDEAIKMKQNGILLTPKDSKVYWSVKDINNNFFKDILKNWQDELYIQTNTVNLNENFQSNTSGVSIRLKLQELENLSAIKEAIFEKALKKRFKFFCDWLKKAESIDLDSKDLSISFVRNVPVDEKTISDMIVELAPYLPLEDLISWHPRVTDPQATIKRLMKERDSMGLLTLDQQLQINNGVTNNGSTEQ